MKGLLDRLVRLLLWTYPEATRRRYGDEISETVKRRVRRMHRTVGALAAMALVVRECHGIVTAGVAIRLRRARRAAPRKKAGKRGGAVRTTDVLFQNLRFATRSLRRQPAFTVVAVAALALGIGASIAIFTVFHAVLLRPLPFRDPGRLVAVWEKNPERGWNQAEVAAANYLDWRSRVRSFVDMAAHNDWLEELVLVAEDGPAVVNGNEVTGNFFDVLGVAPVVGDGFEDSHTWAAGEPVVVLSQGFWKRRFGGDMGVVGGTLELDGVNHRILGVMPEGFAYPFADAELWLPVRWDPENRQQMWFRRAHGMRVIGRLADGISLEEAEAELAAIAAQLESEYPETNRMMGIGVTPLRDWVVGDAARPLLILMAAVGCLLLIACTNVSNMLLARGTARGNELRIKSALGGGRRRLLIEGLTESLLLAGAGGTLGLALGTAAIRPLLAMSPGGLPRIEEIRVDTAIVWFAVAISVGSGVVFGSVPAWRGASVESRDGMSLGTRGASRRTSGATAFLVGAEVALTLPLVVGAGLMVRTLSHLSRVEPGFVTDNVLVARISLPATRYEDDVRLASAYRELLESVGTIPGVEAAAMSSRLPFGNQRWSSDFTVEGWPADRFGINVRHDEISPGLFRTMGVALVRGRDFDAGDGLDTPLVVIINQALADKYFPGQDPVGKRVTFNRIPDADSLWRTIVGVVGNVRRERLGLEEEPSFYAPVLQDSARVMHLLVRWEQDPLTLVEAVRERVRAVDPTIPLFDVTTLDAVVASSVARERFLLSLLAGAAAIALALATVGIFGVVSYSTTRRIREIGIRVALGARTLSVVALVVRGGMGPVFVGVVAGVLAAALSARAMSSLLFEVEPVDPLTFFAVVALVLLAALSACAVPARWATRIETASALRTE